ncbi:MAG: SCP2 sterol-binding domain-containing protein [Endozoicomonadaceae bacterium]|nr:SCP2 sterol-binding domain-containing protein [Endozoicomonadaceae bacterium]
MTTENNIISLIDSHIKPESLSGIDATLQIILNDGEACYIAIINNQYQMHTGIHESPSVTLTTDTDTLTGLIEGRVNSIQAFMTGKIKFSGDMSLAMKLKNIFD